MAICPQVASQHFRSSKTQATYSGCFACQSICLIMHGNILTCMYTKYSIVSKETKVSCYATAIVCFLDTAGRGLSSDGYEGYLAVAT